MNTMLLVGGGMLVLWTMLTAVRLFEYGMEGEYDMSIVDWFFLLLAWTVGPAAIITGPTLLQALIMSPMMAYYLMLLIMDAAEP